MKPLINANERRSTMRVLALPSDSRKFRPQLTVMANGVMMNAFRFALSLMFVCRFGLLACADTAGPVIKLSPLATQGPKPEAVEPPSAAEIASAIERGIEFLLADQRPSGEWGSAEQTKGLNIYAPIPGAHQAFKCAVTSLALLALVEAEPTMSGEMRERVTQAIERGETWLIEHVGVVRRATPDAIYNVWAHAYGLQALVTLYKRAEGNKEKQKQLHGLAEGEIEKLQRYAAVNGGWGYYDFDFGTKVPGGSPTSFITATALIALHEAKGIGLEVPQKMVDKAIASLHRQEKSDFSFAYGEYLRMMPMYSINRPGGSLGRSQACNLALRLFGDPRVTDEVLTTWLNRLFARNGWLSIGRKRPVPHESHFAVAGYFYYYGHLYAAMCIGQLPQSERDYFQDHLARIILPLQERDGSWWDYPFYNYHQQYGTAMAVMTLLRCQR